VGDSFSDQKNRKSRRTIHALQWLREGTPGEDPFRRRTLFDQFSGLHGRRSGRGKPCGKRDPERL